jgi:hypothetical protein
VPAMCLSPCRQSEAAAQHQRSLLSAALDLGMKLLVKPQAGEGLLMRKARDLITVVFGVAVPGAALLLPLAVYRDSGAEVRGGSVCVGKSRSYVMFIEVKPCHTCLQGWEVWCGHAVEADRHSLLLWSLYTAQRSALFTCPSVLYWL